LRSDLVAAVRALAAAGLWHAGASASVRDHRTGWRLITPDAADAVRLRPRDLTLWSAAGECLEGCSASAPEDTPVHLRVHAAVTDAGALVLARPPLVSVLADEALGLPPISRRLARLGGGVRCVPYAPAGSEALARLVAEALGRRQACLITARGAAARGLTPAAAVAALVLLERVGGAYAAAKASGYAPRRLGVEEMARAVRYAGRPLRPHAPHPTRMEGAPWPDPAR
jgi:L-fuculose-phosphate aldolase